MACVSELNTDAVSDVTARCFFCSELQQVFELRVFLVHAPNCDRRASLRCY